MSSKSNKPENAQKKSKLKLFGLKIAKFFKDIKSELKKVVWLTWKEVVASTVTVLVACFLVGAVIWLVDAGMAELYNLLFS